MCLIAPDGKVAHGEIKIGDLIIMLADETTEFHSPRSFGGSALSIFLYVEDVDLWFRRATEAGAKTVRPVQDQFYGEQFRRTRRTSHRRKSPSAPKPSSRS